jgi:hypothetical protein
MDAQGRVPLTYTLADFVAAQRLHATPTRRDALVMAVSIVVFCAGMIQLSTQPALTLISVTAGLLLTVPFWWFVLIPVTARRNFRRLPVAERVFSFILTPAGLRQSSARGQSTLAWRELMFWRANPSTILLYTSRRHFLLMPKRIEAAGFPLQDLEQCLHRELGNPRR